MSALVTGASGGLGRAIAVALARAGHDVAVHHRSDVAGAAETVRLVEATGRRAYAVQRDLAIADPAALDRACTDLLDEVTSQLGQVTGEHGEETGELDEVTGQLGDPRGLDVVVLNAFPQDLTPWADLDAAAWARMLDGGLRPTAALLRAAGQRLPAGGVIVAIGSIEGLRAGGEHTAYAVSKAAVHHLTAAAAHELGASGVRVVGVAPGLIEREGLAQAWPEGVARWERASALGRTVRPEEVAAVVAFLASPAASAVTGVTIPVDAGWSASPGW